MSHSWVNNYFTDDKRPALSAVQKISTQSQLDALVANYSELPPGSSTPISPAGQIYSVTPSAGVLDLEVDGTALTFEFPFKAVGAWRNIWMYNVDYAAVDVAAGAPGLLSNITPPGITLVPNANVYKRLVGGNCFQLAASHTTLIEGCLIDALGHNTDLIVVNSIAGRTAAQDRADKKIYLINSVLKGFRGHLPNHVDGGPGGGPLGDGLHADCIQMQSEQGSFAEFIAENLDVHTGHEGIVMNCVGTDQPGRSVVHRVLFRIDERYIDPDESLRQIIAPIGTNAEQLLMKDVHPYETQIWGGSSVLNNGNHVLHWPAGGTAQYFTDHNSAWGNTGAGRDAQNAIIPVPAEEINMPAFAPDPDFRPNATNVIKHFGLTQWSGIGTQPANTDFAPETEVGRNYDVNDAPVSPPTPPPTGQNMGAFTADSDTLNEIIAAADNAAKRAAVDTALGEGTLTFTLTNGSTVISGTFSGSLWGTAVLAVDDVQLASVSGPGGAVTDQQTLRIDGANSRYVEFPGEAFNFTGPQGSSNVAPGNEIRVTIQYEADVATGATPVLGRYVSGDPNYVEVARPANAVRDLMLASDPPFQFGAFGNGWHRWGTITSPGFTLPHERIHDWRPLSNLDDGGTFTGRICLSRHNYDYARLEEAQATNGGCPKILPIYMLAKWQVSQANINEVQARYGEENQYGQISGPTRYPSFPYGAHPPETWDYIDEYINAVYRPTNQNGPGGERGFGFTPEQFPVIELGNEQKFASKTVNAGRWWDAFPYGSTNVRAFNLMTMAEFAVGLRRIKAVAPAGVLVCAGGWEGDFRSPHRTLADPNAGLSYFQALAITPDGVGGYAIDHQDVINIHPYMYNYDPGVAQTEIDNAHAQLEWVASFLGRPELNDIPFHLNETGHEATTASMGITAQERGSSTIRASKATIRSRAT